jgi:hypothetical protein
MASPLGPVYILKELYRYAAIRLRRECCSLCSLRLVEPGEHGTWGHECKRICRDPRHGFGLYLARHVWLSPRWYWLNIKPMSLCPAALWLPPSGSDRHYSTKGIYKVKNVSAYNPRSCFNVADESCVVSSRVWTVAWCSSCSKRFHVVSVIGWDNERADIKSRRLW